MTTKTKDLMRVREALMGEINFREVCRNFDPTIEDLRSWSRTDRESISALAILDNLIAGEQSMGDASTRKDEVDK